MLRLLRLLRLAKPEGNTEDLEAWPLCRLRHATLHPGATLSGPGALGGSLGAGAEAALVGAGEGGLVVVGFEGAGQDLGRAPHPVHTEGLHRAGVLARVGTWTRGRPGAAAQGYRLVGLRRVRLGPERARGRPFPTVCVGALPEQPEDLRSAPASLRQTLARLAALDVPWAPHWRDSFGLTAGAGLGQWATTLGWRLSPEERLLLFDAPGRIAEVLEDNLAGLLGGLLATD